MDDNRDHLIETLNQARAYLPVVVRHAGFQELNAIGELLLALADVVKGEIAERQLTWHFSEIHRAKERDKTMSDRL